MSCTSAQPTPKATLDALPDELLIAILSHLDLPEPFKLALPTSLYNACLVCRRWRDCAQPLLWTAVVLSDYEGLLPLKREAQATDLSQRVHILGACGGEMVGPDVFKMIPTFPALEDVRLWQFDNEGAEDADKDFWLMVSQAKSINLNSISLLGSLDPPVFPHLVSLSIFHSSINLDHLAAILQPSIVPNLRLLALGQLDDFRTDGCGLPNFETAFLDQLELLQLDFSDYANFPRSLSTHRVPLLVTSALYDLLQSRRGVNTLPYLRHFHLRPFPLSEKEASEKDELVHETEEGVQWLSFNGIVDLLRHLNLSTLLLPNQLRHPSCDKLRRLLVDLSTEKSLDILWEDRPWEEENGVWIREETLRWLRR